MKNLLNRGLSALLALALCLSLWVVAPAPEADAATYVANWGVRGQEATELSSAAQSFYKKAGVTYSGLSSLSGSSTLASVPNSALFIQLQSIMKTYHTHETDYEETKDLYKYTDCQNGNTAYITCIWCGEQYSGAWPYGGDPWNREHTWPKSKSLDGNDPDVDQVDEEDIMLLRPACKGENSSHSNKAYGSTTNDTYFFPNIDKGYGNDARGDIARTMLYVYVRYGNSGYMWGSTGVIQSKDLLLQWMKEDPVDTWEMGRNDSVQSITGTRNIFIDYPELAFKLFNTSVPSGYQTPSGGVDSGSGTTVTMKFMENGIQTSSKSMAEGAAFTFPAASRTPAEGYSFVGWVTSTVNETTARPSTVYTAGGSALAGNRTYYALYSKVDNTQTGSDYVLHSGAVTEGDYLFVAGDGAMTTAANGSAKRLDAIPVTITNNTVYSPDSTLIWHIAPTGDGYYTFYNAAANKYAVANGTANQLVMSATVNDSAKWSISSSGVITNKGNQAKPVNYTLRRNGSYGFACYAPGTGTAPVLYKAATGAVIYTTSTAYVCVHEDCANAAPVAAGCTTPGYTAGVYCNDCESFISGRVEIPALGHAWGAWVQTTKPTCEADGVETSTCSRCGERKTQPVAAIGHSFVGGTCSGCGMTQPADPVYTLVTPENVTAGNYVIGAVRSGTYPTVYLATSTCANTWTVTDSVTTATDGEIENLPDGTQVFTLTGDRTNGFTIGYHNGTQMVYLGYTSAATNKLAFSATYTNKWKVQSFNNGVLLTDGSYNIFQNSTKADAIRGYTGTYATGKGIYLFQETIPQPELPKVAQVGDTQYESFAEAYAAAANGQTVKLLANIGAEKPISLDMTHDLYIDLDGWCLYADVTANGCTVYGKDSVTDTYDSEEYGAVELTGATVMAQGGYLAYEADKEVSFHAYELKLLAVSLDAANDALGYKAQFLGDEVACSMVTGFGFDMGAQLQKSYTLEETLKNGQIFTLRLKNILACNGGELDITASAFVILQGQKVNTASHTTTMRETIEAVNANWSNYSAQQKAAVQSLYAKHSAVIDGWLGQDNNLK